MNSDRSLVAPFAFCLAAAVAAGAWAISLYQERNSIREILDKTQTELRNRVEAHEETVTTLKTNHESELTRALQSHRRELTAMDREWKKEIATIKSKQTTRITKASTQLTKIVDNGDEVKTYIQDLEKRLREGHSVSDEELERLAAIASGLGTLQSQYQRPFAEFSQLKSYFLSAANDEAVIEAPNKRFSSLKRIFSQNFRQQEKEYHQDIGKRKAYKKAYQQFNTAYTRAQSQMESIGANLSSQAKKIYSIIDNRKEETKTRYEDLEEFFKTSKRTLKIHDTMLKFEPGEEIGDQQVITPSVRP